MSLVCSQCNIQLNEKSESAEGCMDIHGSLIFPYCCNCFLTDGRQCIKCKPRAEAFWKDHSSVGRIFSGRDPVDVEGEQELMQINNADISAMLQTADTISPTKLNLCEREGQQRTPSAAKPPFLMIESPSDLSDPAEKPEGQKALFCDAHDLQLPDPDIGDASWTEQVVFLDDATNAAKAATTFHDFEENHAAENDATLPQSANSTADSSGIAAASTTNHDAAPSQVSPSSMEKHLKVDEVDAFLGRDRKTRKPGRIVASGELPEPDSSTFPPFTDPPLSPIASDLAHSQESLSRTPSAPDMPRHHAPVAASQPQEDPARRLVRPQESTLLSPPSLQPTSGVPPELQGDAPERSTMHFALSLNPLSSSSAAPLAAATGSTGAPVAIAVEAETEAASHETETRVQVMDYRASHSAADPGQPNPLTQLEACQNESAASALASEAAAAPVPSLSAVTAEIHMPLPASEVMGHIAPLPTARSLAGPEPPAAASGSDQDQDQVQVADLASLPESTRDQERDLDRHVTSHVPDAHSEHATRAAPGSVVFSHRREAEGDGVLPAERLRRWVRSRGGHVLASCRAVVESSLITAKGERQTRGGGGDPPTVTKRVTHGCLVLVLGLTGLGLLGAWMALGVVTGLHLTTGRTVVKDTWHARNCSVLSQSCTQVCNDEPGAQASGCTGEGSGTRRRTAQTYYLSDNCVWVSRGLYGADAVTRRRQQANWEGVPGHVSGHVPGHVSGHVLGHVGARSDQAPCTCRRLAFLVNVSVRYRESATASGSDVAGAGGGDDVAGGGDDVAVSLRAECAGADSSDVCSLDMLRHRGRVCGEAEGEEPYCQDTKSFLQPPPSSVPCFVDPKNPLNVRFNGSDSPGVGHLALITLWALATALVLVATYVLHDEGSSDPYGALGGLAAAGTALWCGPGGLDACARLGLNASLPLAPSDAEAASE